VTRWLFAGGFWLAGVLVGYSLFGLLQQLATPDITHAIGVISRCGIYAVATIDSLGGVEAYDAAREAPAAVEAAVNALPESARTAILVPCPVEVAIPGERIG
jgi:hypothetical protein